MARLSEAKNLPEHLSKILMSYYKKNDPNRQSLWTTDVTRLRFIIKSGDGWIKDDNAEIIKKNIITPLLEEVVKVMDRYCNDKMKYIRKMSHSEEAKFVEVSKQRINIKSDVLK